MNTVAEKVYRNVGNPEVLKLVPARTRVVLDVGCGAGDNAALLTARGCKVDCITLSHEEAAVARDHCRFLHVGNLEQGLPKTLATDYDCAICSHVLEHICWPERLLADLAVVLRPQRGVLIVALPNIMFYKNRWRLARGDFHYEPSGLMDNTHFRWYTFTSAREMLERNGFVVEFACTHGSAPLWPLRALLGRGITDRIDAFANKIAPGVFGYQLLFLARPA